MINSEKKSFVSKFLSEFSRGAVLGNAGDRLFTKIQKHVKNPAFYTAFNLDPHLYSSEFFLWAIHLWMIYRRLRFEGDDGSVISNIIATRFWYQVEFRLT